MEHLLKMIVALRRGILDQLICGGVIKIFEGKKKRCLFFWTSQLSASWPIFVKPSQRMHERGETRDNFVVHAATSDLNVKKSRHSRRTLNRPISPRTQKPKGDSRHIRSFFCFLFSFFFLGEGGRRKTSRTPLDTSCGGVFSGTMRRKVRRNF